jgi:hypothetical protein
MTDIVWCNYLGAGSLPQSNKRYSAVQSDMFFHTRDILVLGPSLDPERGNALIAVDVRNTRAHDEWDDPKPADTLVLEPNYRSTYSHFPAI